MSNAACYRYLLHPTTIEGGARALERADLPLRYDLTWQEMDEVERDYFRQATRIILDVAAEGLRDAPTDYSLRAAAEWIVAEGAANVEGDRRLRAALSGEES